MTLTSDDTQVTDDTPTTILLLLSQAVLTLPWPLSLHVAPGVQRQVIVHAHHEGEATEWRGWISAGGYGYAGWTESTHVDAGGCTHHHLTTDARGWTVDITWITRDDEQEAGHE